MPPRKSGASYHHGDLRRALLDAGARVLRRSGAGTLTLRQVARYAKVSHQAPYHHFPSRAHLLAALAAEGFDLLAGELELVQRAASSPPEAARASGVQYVVFAAEHPHLFDLMFGSELGAREPYADLHASAERVFSLLLRPFGLTSTDSSDPTVLALWSTVHGLASLTVDGQARLEGARLVEAAQAVMDTLWNGVRDSMAAATGPLGVKPAARKP